jgi:Ca2+-binding EF-hand superfamily protein
LDNAFLREGLSPAIAFKHADTDRDGVIKTEELREAIKRLIPEDSISFIDLRNVLMAFDQNRNGMIEE